MSDAIQDMAKAIYETLSPMHRIRGCDWADIPLEEELPWLNAAKAALQSQWIEIEARCPGHGVPVWLCSEKGGIFFGHRHGDRFFDVCMQRFLHVRITHWMPLVEPPPPKPLETP